MQSKIDSGRRAKQEGHSFEHLVGDYLSEQLNREFLVEGASNTKIDVRDTQSNVRLSVKNPSGKNTQIGLYTQKSFIDALQITDKELILFIQQFFGHENYSDHPRHRMSKSTIDPKLNERFTDFLNAHKKELLDLLCTHGHNQKGDVNYLIWANEKNNPESVSVIDLNRFKESMMKGRWTQNETTFEYVVEDKKMFHLQMKGSGTKYTNGYHGMMFHIHNNFQKEYMVDMEILK